MLQRLNQMFSHLRVFWNGHLVYLNDFPSGNGIKTRHSSFLSSYLNMNVIFLITYPPANKRAIKAIFSTK